MSRAAREPPAVDKIAYNVLEAAAAIGVGKTAVWEMLADGTIQAKKFRGRTLIPRSELERIIAEAPPARDAA